MLNKYERTALTIRIYVTNLGAYNRGTLKGEWLDLPMDEEELKEAIKDILSSPYNDEEYFITDYEGPFEIGEFEDIYALNELAEELDGISEDEAIVSIIADEILGNNYDKQALINILRDSEYSVAYEVWNEQDLALKVDEELLPFDYSLVKNAGIDNYLDWEAIGRDMVLDGWVIKNGYAVKVYI